MQQKKQMTLQEMMQGLGVDSSKLTQPYGLLGVKWYGKEQRLLLELAGGPVSLLEIDGAVESLRQALQLDAVVCCFSGGDSGSGPEVRELVAANWHNLSYLIEKQLPACKNQEDKLSWELRDGGLVVRFDSSIFYQKAVERRLDQLLADYFQQYHGRALNCTLEEGQEAAQRLEAFQAQQEKTSTAYAEEVVKTVKEAAAAAPALKTKPQNGGFKPLEEREGRRPRNEVKDANTLFGRSFQGPATALRELTSEQVKIIVEGELVDFEVRLLNSGRKLFSLYLTDFSNSVKIKIFERKTVDPEFEEKLKKGLWLRVRGDMVYDKYEKEYVMMGTDIMVGQKQELADHAPKKRIELHLHTQMSSMDGVSSATSLIKQAAKWGHPAVAITDHGVVQAFPEAMEAGKKHGVKILYGMEGYLVNDEAKIVEGDDQYPLLGEFVVFDIETTGLSNKNDKITEIGAVKVRNGEIVDSFATFVDPQVPIPYKITELTGITDEMVKGAPLIDQALPDFLAFAGGAPLVAHNAGFDIGFMRESGNRLGYKLPPGVVDTLKLSRILLSHLKRHKLDIVAKELKVELLSHHRAVDDAKATAEIWIHFINMLLERELHTLGEVNRQLGEKVDFTKQDTYHIILLARNDRGLRNLYQLVSQSHLNYFYKKPRIPKSLLKQYREGLILGTACEAGELYQAYLNDASQETLEEIAAFYDYLEIQPLANNTFLIEKGKVRELEDLKEINRKILALGEARGKPVVATGDVHFLDRHAEVFRRILMAGQGFPDANEQAPLYLRTTEQMLAEFNYLTPEQAQAVVVEYPHQINDMIEEMIPIPNGTFPPVIEGSEEELRRRCYEKAERIYGNPLPELVQSRLDRELNSIISNGYAVMYIIAQKLVTKSLEDGYLVGSRGSVGSSFAATMSDITEVNPLPPHYVCEFCQHSEFILDGSYGSGADLPNKDCPQCGRPYQKEGHDIPFEVFLGFEGDKEPDIDLNFAGEYQSEAHRYTEELFGKGKVYRAGTIGTIAEKTAYGFVKKYLEAENLPQNQAEINRLTLGCTGVRRTSGQHPGGVMIVPADRDIHEFCPIQYPANDAASGVVTTHFDYHSISGRLLKLDILGHDVPTIIKMLEDLTGVNAQRIPLDDQPTMSLFTSTAVLKVDNQKLNCEVGTLGIPEFGTKFVRQMLMDTRPSTLSELFRISGLSHGTDVWVNNAQDLVRNQVAELKDVISTRDDIMNYLIYKGLPKKTSFKIMENVRKGKGLTPENEEEMRQFQVPEWYIDSCNKIKYMFPKAHAVAYVVMSFRIAYFKVHHPEAFYATYFTTKAEDFDADLIVKGEGAILQKIKELEALGNQATAKEKNLLTVLEVALEMFLRQIELLPVDLYQSDADRFLIVENKLLPPLKALQGVGENAAKNIVEARQEGEFISLEDLRVRAKITKTAIETLVNHGCIRDLPQTNQLSLF